MCERHNGIVADAYYKLKDEMPRSDPAIILAWVTNSKNSVANIYDHSPYTLVIKRTPSAITTLDDDQMVTTMNQSTVNKVIVSKSDQLYVPVETVIRKANNHDKLKRAFGGGGGFRLRPIILETSIWRYGLKGKARTRPDFYRVVLGPCAQFYPCQASEQK